MDHLEMWRFWTGFLAGAVVSGVPSLWAINRRPTFTQVETMISKSTGVQLIAARLDNQDKILEKLDRHFTRLEEKVDEIHLDVEVQRKMRSKAQGGDQP